MKTRRIRQKKVSNKDLDTIFKNAKTANHRGSEEEALVHYQQLLEANYKKGTVLLSIAKIHASRSRFKEAEKAFDEAIHYQSKDDYMGRALAEKAIFYIELYQRGHLNDGLIKAKKTLEAVPEAALNDLYVKTKIIHFYSIVNPQKALALIDEAMQQEAPDSFSHIKILLDKLSLHKKLNQQEEYLETRKMLLRIMHHLKSIDDPTFANKYSIARIISKLVVKQSAPVEPEIIEYLENETRKNEINDPTLCRSLAQAYVSANQINKALDTYERLLTPACGYYVYFNYTLFLIEHVPETPTTKIIDLLNIIINAEQKVDPVLLLQAYVALLQIKSNDINKAKHCETARNIFEKALLLAEKFDAVNNPKLRKCVAQLFSIRAKLLSTEKKRAFYNISQQLDTERWQALHGRYQITAQEEYAALQRSTHIAHRKLRDIELELVLNPTAPANRIRPTNGMYKKLQKEVDDLFAQYEQILNEYESNLTAGKLEKRKHSIQSLKAEHKFAEAYSELFDLGEKLQRKIEFVKANCTKKPVVAMDAAPAVNVIAPQPPVAPLVVNAPPSAPARTVTCSTMGIFATSATVAVAAATICYKLLN